MDLLNKKQVEELLYDLSSFYRDFLPVDNQLMKLFDIYAHTINYAWDVFGEAHDSKYVSTTRTLSTIPYFKVNIDEAMYDLKTTQMLTRMTFEEQVAYLDKERKYASFVFNTKDAAGEPTVFSMRLFTKFSDGDALRIYEDYFVRSNRLYLLPNYMLKRKQTVHFLHAFEIKINDNSLEKNFGSRFDINAGPLLPRFEYRDVLEAFEKVFKGDMTIKAIKESIKLATKWETFKLEDFKSPNISPRKKQLYDDWIVSPNKFLLTLPESLIQDKVRINIIKSLLEEAKQADKDYMFFFDIFRKDFYTPRSQSFPTVRYNRGEELFVQDEQHVEQVKMTFIDYPLDVEGRYDTSYSYNYNLQYDDPPGNEIIGLHINNSTTSDSLVFTSTSFADFIIGKGGGSKPDVWDEGLPQSNYALFDVEKSFDENRNAAALFHYLFTPTTEEITSWNESTQQIDTFSFDENQEFEELDQASSFIHSLFSSGVAEEEWAADLTQNETTLLDYDQSFNANASAGEFINTLFPTNEEEDVREGLTENVTVTHFTSPIIPREFKVTKTGEDIFFSINSSADAMIEFELYQSNALYGIYELVEVLPNDQNIATIFFQHNAKGSQKTYYKCRAKDPSDISLFTLAIDTAEQPAFDDAEMIETDLLRDDAHVFVDGAGVEDLLAYLGDLTITYTA